MFEAVKCLLSLRMGVTMWMFFPPGVNGVFVFGSLCNVLVRSKNDSNFAVSLLVAFKFLDLKALFCIGGVSSTLLVSSI